MNWNKTKESKSIRLHNVIVQRQSGNTFPTEVEIYNFKSAWKAKEKLNTLKEEALQRTYTPEGTIPEWASVKQEKNGYIINVKNWFIEKAYIQTFCGILR